MPDDNQSECTVRELGGEMFSALAALKGEAEYKGLDAVDFASQKLLIELAMRVLATHVGSTIVQDPELPVEALDAAMLQGNG